MTNTQVNTFFLDKAISFYAVADGEGLEAYISEMNDKEKDELEKSLLIPYNALKNTGFTLWYYTSQYATLNFVNTFTMMMAILIRRVGRA